MNRALLLIHSWIADAFAVWLSTLRGPLSRELASLLAVNERLRTENDILRARLRRIPPRERPRYRPEERLAILAHRQRWKLSFDDTARRFVVSIQTLVNWRKAVEAGITHLVSAREPWNKLADLVREVVHAVKRERPRWGSARIAAILAALGLTASRRSVQRILRKRPPRCSAMAHPTRTRFCRPVHPREPNDVWYLDFTTVKAFMGLVTVTIGAIVDAFSRRVIAIEAWSSAPDAHDAILLVRRAIDVAGEPRYVVTDRGTQFTARLFGRFLSCTKIRRRFGAVRHPQSVARIERFWRSLKDEWTDPLFALRPLATIRRQLAVYARWFNDVRVHAGLGGRTPSAVFAVKPPRRPRRLVPGRRYALCVIYLDKFRKLPKFGLRAA